MMNLLTCLKNVDKISGTLNFLRHVIACASEEKAYDFTKYYQNLQSTSHYTFIEGKHAIPCGFRKKKLLKLWIMVLLDKRSFKKTWNRKRAQKHL